MSQVEETLGGLRIIKAFCAEDKMNERFDRVNSNYRSAVQRVNIRQQMAHPMSEFLGTVLIIIVLWVGGVLVLDKQMLSGPTFIYYLVMLYSIINPLKEFSKAGYNTPRDSPQWSVSTRFSRPTTPSRSQPIRYTSSRSSTRLSSATYRSSMASSGC